MQCDAFDKDVLHLVWGVLSNSLCLLDLCSSVLFNADFHILENIRRICKENATISMK